MICIRADANEKIGTGHVMRCMAIADAMKQCGQQVCFLIADKEGSRLLKNRNQQYLVLDTDYTALEEELPVLRRIFSGGQLLCHAGIFSGDTKRCADRAFG